MRERERDLLRRRMEARVAARHIQLARKRHLQKPRTRGTSQDVQRHARHAATHDSGTSGCGYPQHMCCAAGPRDHTAFHTCSL